jgi:hypothetical protein
MTNEPTAAAAEPNAVGAAPANPTPVPPTPPVSTPALTSERTGDVATTSAEQNGKSVTIKKDAVIGVRLDRALTTETCHADDRVTARIARDVAVDDRTALAAGTRVEGYVAVVERDPRSTDRVRIGIRFTSLVLADDRRVPIQVETVFRESDPPDDAAASGAGAALSSLLSSGSRAAFTPRQRPPAPPVGENVRIPAGSLLTMKLTAALCIDR